MPLYDYKCARCGEVFEVKQKFSDPPLTVHEGCGGEVRRLLSAPALQFKGSGWYITDYAKGGSSGKSASSEANGGKSSESKPASDSGSGSETKAPSAGTSSGSDPKS